MSLPTNSRTRHLLAEFWLAIARMILALVIAIPAAAANEPAEHFRNAVLPILEKHCFACHSHSARKAKGGLMLDSRSGWVNGGDSGPALVPGKPEESLLVQAIRYGDLKMPPTGKLPEELIHTIERWVRDGADDPRVLDPAQARFDKGRAHWAFQAIQDPKVPAVAKASWPKNDVDRFILERLEERQLEPTSDADRHTWLRRLSFDLTGLPPTTEEIADFVNDASDQAEMKVVSRLLDSSAFGERWGRHWLDLVGFADQIGTANDIYAEHAWRYRDYVIDSINADKPFNEFIREQLAGDLLPYASPKQRAANLVATGFLLLGDLTIVEADKAKLRVDVVDQQVDKVGRAFLGMTLGCARCHDHKFDPISQKDYYALAGFFFSTESVIRAKWGVWSWPNLVDLPETEQEQAERTAKAEQRQQQVEALKADLAKRNSILAEITAALAKPDGAIGESKTVLTKLQQDLNEQIRRLQREIQHAEFFAPAIPQAFGVRDITEPVDMQITIRGNAYVLGERVPRGFLQVISDSSAPQIRSGESGRRELANWITSPENTLTTRVFVNRTWQRLFGVGLVPSVDYLGLPGDPPSHPQLLDYLATRFRNEGWSLKKLVGLLVLSRTYQLRSEGSESKDADPENRWYWRMNRQRLDAESIRDALLAVSGRLIPSLGGPTLPLEFPDNTGSLEPEAVNPPFFRPNKFRTEHDYLRTVYLPVIRSAPQPGPADIRNYFDFALPAEFAGQRTTTAVPTQALFLMNSPFMKARASDLAKRAMAANSDDKTVSGKALAAGPQHGQNSRPRMDREMLRWLWLRVFGRPIEPVEEQDAVVFLQTSAAQRPPAESANTKPPVVDNQEGATKEDTTNVNTANAATTKGNAELTNWIELCHALIASNEFLMRQ